MTPAELKTLRESLGLTAQWLANQVDVKLRSVQYWESGRSAVPEDVAILLSDINDKINHAVAQAVVGIKRNAKAQKSAPSIIHLLRYKNDDDLWDFRPDMHPLPATNHAVILARLVDELNEASIENRIIYMQPENYMQWLDGREDGEEMRAAWAARQEN